MTDDFVLLAGSANPRLAAAIAAYLAHPLCLGETLPERLFITDSVETQPVELSDRIEVVSVAGLFGEAIRRISRRESISVLFS